MASKVVWRDALGALFHDECFLPGESREGYTKVALDEVNLGEDCTACGGMILDDMEDANEDDDVDEDDD